MTDEFEKKYTVKEAAYKLDLSVPYTYRLLKLKKIGHFKLGISCGYRVPESELKKYIESKKVEAEMN